MNIRRRTLEADCVHHPICALLALLPLSLDYTTRPRCTRADEVIVIVGQVCFGTYEVDGKLGIGWEHRMGQTLSLPTMIKILSRG
jgi:hypothetical protein